jgi:hypothetical protein
METTPTALTARHNNLSKLVNKIETLEEISQLHYSLEFQQTIDALRTSVHFTSRLAAQEDPASDKSYYFEHMTIMADAMHYISCMEHILTTSRELEAAESVS